MVDFKQNEEEIFSGDLKSNKIKEEQIRSVT